MEYAREGLDGLEITYKDNRPVLDLFLTRPIGLLSLLDEQCRGFSVRKPVLQREQSGITSPILFQFVFAVVVKELALSDEC